VDSLLSSLLLICLNIAQGVVVPWYSSLINDGVSFIIDALGFMLNARNWWLKPERQMDSYRQRHRAATSMSMANNNTDPEQLD
jgi:hypothetical protein